MAWLYGWGRRKKITLGNLNGTGTEYQVRVIVHRTTATEPTFPDVYLNPDAVQSDFNDIRFTDNDEETELYYMKLENNTNTALFWVKINDDLSSVDVDIYIYYEGVGTKSDNSDGPNTFLDWEDWEGGIGGRWSTSGSPTTNTVTVYQGSNSLEINGPNERVWDVISSYGAHAIGTRFRHGSWGGRDAEGAFIVATTTITSRMGVDKSVSNTYYVKVQAGTTTALSALIFSNTWHKFEIRIHSSNRGYWINDVFQNSWAVSNINHIEFRTFQNNDSLVSFYLDAFYIRKTVSYNGNDQPSGTIAAEELLPNVTITAAIEYLDVTHYSYQREIEDEEENWDIEAYRDGIQIPFLNDKVINITYDFPTNEIGSFSIEMDNDENLDLLEEDVLRFRVCKDPGLVAYYHFDENTGSELFDSSGNNLKGTIYNSPPWVDGKYGKALDFNGSTTYVEIAAHPSLFPSNAITIMFWVYIDSADINTSAYFGFVCRDIRTDGLQAIKNYTDGKVMFETAGAGGLTSTEALTPDVWNHVVCVLESGISAKIYINGVEKGSNSGWALPTVSMDYWIGRAAAGTSNPYLDGLIDEVRIYGRVVSHAEILRLYNLSAPDYTWNNPRELAMGRITKAKRSVRAKERFLTLEGTLKGSILKTRTYTGSFEEVDPGAIADAIIANAVGTTSIDGREIDSSGIRIFQDAHTISFKNKKDIVCLQEHAEGTKADFYVDPLMIFRFFKILDNSAFNLISSEDMEDYDFNEGTEEIINKVTVIGIDLFSTMPSPEDDWTDVIANWTAWRNPGDTETCLILDATSKQAGNYSIKAWSCTTVEDMTIDAPCSSLGMRNNSPSLSLIDWTYLRFYYKAWSLVTATGSYTDGTLRIKLETNTSNYYYKDISFIGLRAGMPWFLWEGITGDWDSVGSPTFTSINDISFEILDSGTLTKKYLWIDWLYFTKGTSVTVEDAQSQIDYGVRETEDIHVTGSPTLQELTDIGYTIISEYKRPKPCFTNLVIDGRARYRPGDTVKIECEDYTGYMSIKSIKHQVREGDFETRLILGKAIEKLEDRLKSLDYRITSIETT